MKRVLIIDDSPSVLRLLQFVFEGEHYDVDVAADGAEGLRKIDERMPDVVVTDSIMPGMDGYALLRKLKEKPATSAIPVIMLTSEDAPAADSLDGRLKPDAFVKKSADFAALLISVTQALGSR